jgi:predicted RNA-binding Zn-ribbon protein involved in translation (DUF1610 family)
MSEYRQKCIKKKGRHCHICGEKDNIDVHHIDGDRTNNNLENLIPVCRYCHIGIHENRDNYSHWYNRLLPWYTNSDEEFNQKYSTQSKVVSNRNLIDDLIFIENLNSTAARRLAKIETDAVPFRCPNCGSNQNLGSEYSLKNRKTCPKCSWSGPVYQGAIEAMSKNEE